MKSSVAKYDGLLALNKPAGISSHDAVDRVRRIIRQRAVGHAGTLDPAAEGLLLLLLGRATKFARYLSDHDKVYEAVVRLGRTSKTFDAEGVDLNSPAKDIPNLGEDGWNELLERFRGRIVQKVPAYSAVHVDGERLYAKARRGEDLADTPAREVEIHGLELHTLGTDTLALRVRCSKGTYIRSLAHDIGEAAGCGAYLAELKRTAIGNLGIEKAVTFEELETRCARGDLNTVLASVDDVLAFGSLLVTDDFRGRVADGVAPNRDNVTGYEGEFRPGDTILVRDRARAILAIATARVASDKMSQASGGKLLNYERVLR